jgi:hypothetical protein
MSIQPLLEPDTKLQPWSALYCNSLHAVSATIDNLDGSLVTQPSILQGGSYTMTIGTGTLSSQYNLVSSWVSNNSTSRFRRIDASLFYTATVAGVYSAPSTTWTIDLTLPFAESLQYPVDVGSIMPGAVSGNINDGAANPVLTGKIVAKDAAHVTIYAYAAGDLSAASGGRNMTISYTLTYQVPPAPVG